jgi:hypothetical protein
MSKEEKMMVGPEPIPIEDTEFHHAMWIHGTAGQLDWEPALPDMSWQSRLNMLADPSFLMNRIGTGLRIELTGSLSGNYVIHYPMPTQNKVAVDTSLLLQSVMLDFDAHVVEVGKVTVRDGGQTITVFDNLNLAGNHALEFLILEEPIRVIKGVNISVALYEALGGIGTILIRAVGVNMVTRGGVVGPLET